MAGADVRGGGRRFDPRLMLASGTGLALLATPLLLLGCGNAAVQSGNDAAPAAAAAAAAGGELSGGRPKFGPPPWMKLFQDNCAACHTQEGMNMGGRAIPSIPTLRGMSPERIFDVMLNGKMQEQAAALDRVQKKQVAEFLGGRPMMDAAGTDVKTMSNRCATNPAFALTAGDWNGWSPQGSSNARFQKAGGVAAGDVPKLKLKWAFGVPQAASMFSQPAAAGGRLFFGSDNGTVYGISGETGCAYWSFHADSGIRTAPVVQPVTGQKEKFAVIFASQSGTVFAVGARTGELLWKTRPSSDPHGLTGSIAAFDGRVYIPFTGTETLAGANPKYECCKSSGGVAAIDASTGTLIWFASSIQQPIVSRGKNELGVPMWGPSGASVWNTPTVDAKRKLIYFGTGNSYNEPAAATSDSIVAIDMATGKIRWHHQEIAGDAFVLGCPDTAPAGNHCPSKIGPDWDFGGASVILKTLPNGKDILIGSGKHGIAVAVDPDQQGKVVWRTRLYADKPPTADGLVIFGGGADDRHIYYPLQRAGGGLTALDLATGKPAWTATLDTDGRGQIGPASVMPGVVFTGGWDGVLRAVDLQGRVVWRFDTKRDFPTVNGIPGKGGSLGQAGAVVANGRVYVASGYVGMQNGAAGNVILAFAPQ